MNCRRANCINPRALKHEPVDPQCNSFVVPVGMSPAKKHKYMSSGVILINQQTWKSDIMNTLQLKGNWNIIKGKLKQKYANLTDDDLEFIEGKEDELIGRIQKRTGTTKVEVEQTLDECNCCES
jgi:uncharacterized protein YjbJ (UPF0337 family)